MAFFSISSNFPDVTLLVFIIALILPLSNFSNRVIATSFSGILLIFCKNSSEIKSIFCLLIPSSLYILTFGSEIID